MQIVSSTFRESVYEIIDALEEHGVSKKVFEDSASKEKTSIYGGEGCFEISPISCSLLFLVVEIIL